MADYKSFKLDDGKAVNKDKRIQVNSTDTTDYSSQRQWWLYSDLEEVLGGVKQMLALLEGDLSNRLGRYRVESRLYGVVDYFASWGRASNGSNWQSNNVVLPDRLQMNVVQSNVDTLVSKVSRLKPRARFLTNNGGFKAVKAAKKLGYFSDGIFQENDIYSTARSIVRDALVFGDGFCHAYEDDGRVKLERVAPYEIFVDQLEAVGGNKLSHMYRLRLMPRAQLVAKYPQFAADINMSVQLFNTNVHMTSPATDQIELLECWHIGSGESMSDGKHMLAVPGKVLVYEDWKEKTFPISRISWTQPFSGYWSQSLAEQLKSTQLEINKLLAVMQRSYHLAGSFKILVPNGSQIPTESFNNAVGTVIKYVGGQAPSYITPPILPPEFYRHLDTLINRSYQISGVSQLSAYSQKPSGLNSGVALREYNDIESTRFQEFSQDIEQFFVDIAKTAIQVVKAIAQKNAGHYPVNMPGPRSLNKLDFKEISIADEDYTIGTFPASSLPNDPAGRLEAIDDLVKRGLLDPVEQRELLSFPDIEASNTLSTSQDEYLKEVFERMLEEGVYTPPDPYDNLQLAQKLGLQYYALGKKLGESEDKLELIRTFMRDLLALQAPEPTIPTLPAPELGAQLAPAELSQLSLPTASGPLPGVEAALAAGSSPLALA